MRAPAALVRDVSASIGRDEVLELEIGDLGTRRAVDGDHAAG